MKNKIKTSVAFIVFMTLGVFLYSDNTGQKIDSSDVKKLDIEKESLAGDLESIEVTAYRFGDSIFEVPINLTQISAKDIEESGQTSLVDVMKRSANIYFRDTGANPMDGEISMRGFGENSSQRVLVLLDGQRLNRPDMAFINWAQLPLENIENVEILRGSQSAIYGNYAVGGVVKITTKKPEKGTHANGGGSYGSYGEENAWARASYADEDYYVVANGNYYRFGGYRDFSEVDSNSAGITVGAIIDTFNEVSINANLTESYREFPSPFYSYEQAMKDPRYATLDATSWSNYGVFELNWKNATDVGEGNFQVGANTRDERYKRWNASRNDQWTLSFTPRYRFFLADDKKSYIEGGVDFYYDDMTTDVYNDFDRKDLSTTGEVTRETVGPWGNFKWTEDIVSCNISGRYEVANTSANYRNLGVSTLNYDESKLQHAPSIQAAINVEMMKNMNTYFRFDQLYRYPALDELAGLWGTGFNSKVKPEKGQNFEVGTNYIDDNWVITASVFCMLLQDEISVNPITWETMNIGNTRRIGSDIHIGYNFNKYVGIDTQWAFIDARFTSEAYSGSDVPLVPNIYSTSEFWVKPIGNILRLSFIYNWTSSQYLGSDNFNVGKKIPSYGTFDIRATVKFCEYASGWVSVDNLGDKVYVNNGYYVGGGYPDGWYPAMGRMIRVGVSIKF